MEIVVREVRMGAQVNRHNVVDGNNEVSRYGIDGKYRALNLEVGNLGLVLGKSQKCLRDDGLEKSGVIFIFGKEKQSKNNKMSSIS